MRYRDFNFSPAYSKRPATEEEIALQELVTKRSNESIELDSWVRINADPHFDPDQKTTLQFLGWLVDKKDETGGFLVKDAHEFIDSLLAKP